MGTYGIYCNVRFYVKGVPDVGFSIIIPAYNAETTLARCLQSIRKQTYEDYQVILVDDGSEDNTLALARRLTEADPRYTVVSRDHHGPGAARNRGLPYVRKEYVVYLDADDYWIRDDLLQLLHRQISRGEADVYMYQMVKVTDDGTVLERYAKAPFQKENQILPLGEVYFDLVKDGQALASACNKCVRSQLLRHPDIAFVEESFGEDIDWVLQLFARAQSICLMNLQAYAYTQHKAISRSTHPDAPNDLVTIVSRWADRVEQEDLPHRQAVAGLVAFEYGICLGSIHRLCAEKVELLRQNAFLLGYGLDRKTRLIWKFYRVFGFRLTGMAVRAYLWLRRIW